MRNRVTFQLAWLVLLPDSAVAQNVDPYTYVKRLPTDCEDVREMINIKTGKMEFLYVASCNRAGITSFAKIEGVRKISPSVISVPMHKTKPDQGSFTQMIAGYYCSGLPVNAKDSATWICASSGWTSE